DQEQGRDHAEPRERNGDETPAQEEPGKDRAAYGEERRGQDRVPPRGRDQEEAERARRRPIRSVRAGSGGREPQQAERRHGGEQDQEGLADAAAQREDRQVAVHVPGDRVQRDGQNEGRPAGEEREDDRDSNPGGVLGDQRKSRGDLVRGSRAFEEELGDSGRDVEEESEAGESRV